MRISSCSSRDPTNVKIYERGVAAVPKSVDLWTHYLTFLLDTQSSDAHGMRNIFESGATAVGLDFLAHPFWDKYVEYEESMAGSEGSRAVLIELLGRIIRIPMHQYARYYERYLTLVSSRPALECMDAENYNMMLKNIQGSDGGKMTSEEIEKEMKSRIQRDATTVYTHTQTETNRRWPFEAEVKRPYFHVKPLDEPQVQNWHRYLRL